VSKRYRDAYGDAIYETWMQGGNPDEVDYERVRDDVDYGYDRFEASSREAGRIVRRSVRELEGGE